MNAKISGSNSDNASNLNDGVLGKVRFVDHVNPKLDVYEAFIDVDERKIQLELFTDIKLNIGPAIKNAKTLLRRMKKLQKNIFDHLKRIELPEYNDSWRADGAPVLSIDEFTSYICLSKITVNASDGTSAFWFDVDDLLFGGHIIVVDLDSQWNISDSEIAG